MTQLSVRPTDGALRFSVQTWQTHPLAVADTVSIMYWLFRYEHMSFVSHVSCWDPWRGNTRPQTHLWHLTGFRCLAFAYQPRANTNNPSFPPHRPKLSRWAEKAVWLHASRQNCRQDGRGVNQSILRHWYNMCILVIAWERQVAVWPSSNHLWNEWRPHPAQWKTSRWSCVICQRDKGEGDHPLYITIKSCLWLRLGIKQGDIISKDKNWKG